jgi:hypothetical protein
MQRDNKMITTTVGDIMTILSKYPLNTPVVKHNPDGNGYYRIVITRMMCYPLMVNQDNSLPFDFVDCIVDGIPEAFSAIVL